MSRDHDPNRRLLLKFLAVAGVDAMIPGVAAAGVPDEVDRKLLAIITDREGACAIGDAYLASRPSEQSADSLVDLIVGERLDEFYRASLDQCRQLIATDIEADFARGNTADVKGWLLSRTEARLCGLVTLSKII